MGKFDEVRKKYPEIYHSWNGARTRCRCSTNKDYKRYGGRGIQFDARWERFEDFCKWSVEHGWKKGLTLDRIDVNGNYAPDNCRWVDLKVQANNRRSSVYLTVNGTRKSCREWSNQYGVPHTTVSYWIAQDGILEAERRFEAIAKEGYNGRPKSYYVRCVTTGETFPSIRETCKRLNLNRTTLVSRLNDGKPYRGCTFEYCEPNK